MPQYKILIIDDEKNTRDGLQKLLSFEYKVETCEDALKGLDLIKKYHYDLVLTDLNMPMMNGFEFIKEVVKLDGAPLVIMLTAYGSVEVAVEAMKVGAYDYLTKPVNIDNLEMLIKRGIDSIKLIQENKLLKQQLSQSGESNQIIGQSEDLVKILADVEQMAPAKATVLISGESGTGKELIAEALHKLSPRKHKPFITVHCASLNANLLESELFGHEKGAFTGAITKKIGRIELADEGTLFLDEIGEIDSATQVKLLRVLESRKFERVGGTQTIQSNARIVCATNRALKKEVEQGNFRQDLYFRLSVLNITLPPLRARKDDIEALLNHYLSYFNSENGKKINKFQPEALHLLKAYDWPGNVRELRNMVERMVVMSKGGDLSVGEIPNDIHQLITLHPQLAVTTEDRKPLKLADNEEQLIDDALECCDQNITHAAKRLGISRRTLQRKIKKRKDLEL